MMLKVLEQGHREVLGAIGNGKKHRQDLEMNQQHLNLVQRVK